jgi:hypothetical protein
MAKMMRSMIVSLSWKVGSDLAIGPLYTRMGQLGQAF